MNDSNLHFRLRDVLISHHARVKTWHALEKAIQQASDGKTIDRRKLQRIGAPGEEYKRVHLTVAELMALDQYLLRHNEGLAEKPIFRRSENLLDAISESLVVNFFVAAKHHQALNTEAISRWDMRAITRLMRTKLHEIDLNIWDVGSIEDWEKLQANERALNEAKISIGSPLACQASEYLMSDMIGINPFESCPIERLPFFVFGIEQPIEAPSAFIRTLDEVKQIPAYSGKLGPLNRGIVVGQKVYTIKNRNEDLALLVAHRHPKEKKTHAVLCGLSGPATYALAKCIQRGRVDRTLPELGEEVLTPILVAVVQVQIAGQSDTKIGLRRHEIEDIRDRRKLTDFEIIDPIIMLRYENEEWGM